MDEMEPYLSKYVENIKSAKSDKDLEDIIDDIYNDGYCDAVNEAVEEAVS
jgi:hypothetical protein